MGSPTHVHMNFEFNTEFTTQKWLCEVSVICLCLFIFIMNLSKVYGTTTKKGAWWSWDVAILHLPEFSLLVFFAQLEWPVHTIQSFAFLTQQVSVVPQALFRWESLLCLALSQTTLPLPSLPPCLRCLWGNPSLWPLAPPQALSAWVTHWISRCGRPGDLLRSLPALGAGRCSGGCVVSSPSESGGGAGESAFLHIPLEVLRTICELQLCFCLSFTVWSSS